MADGNGQAAVPTALYRHYDANGTLLYVGISTSVMMRLAQHRWGSHWFTRVVRVTIEWLPTREAALNAEREAIRKECPECNTVHALREGERSDDGLSLADASRVALAREYARFKAVYTVTEAAEALSVSVSAIRLAMFHRELPFMDMGGKLAITGWALIDFLEALESGQIAMRKLARLPDGGYERVPNIEAIRAGR